ncbi:hypothetical protein [Sporolactobacillus terrae]|uniref:Uncharacterized protein n=2 Tax=Sporolactobacillus terrae TaxID=269673 RepID=A0ABX5Q5D6_9BACL|nr:hypothetical protein [Sporolactobacillus terrae]QAA21844.1 hypothetical protein C0674_03990 [Sporolactobacillus terrae]QAA24817.1 hypothetical protein C0679_03965 [Sporolactobacillus terrae]
MKKSNAKKFTFLLLLTYSVVSVLGRFIDHLYFAKSDPTYSLLHDLVSSAITFVLSCIFASLFFKFIYPKGEDN